MHGSAVHARTREDRATHVHTKHKRLRSPSDDMHFMDLLDPIQVY